MIYKEIANTTLGAIVDTIREAILESNQGWQEISSNPGHLTSQDGYVFVNEPVVGKKLVYQLKPVNITSGYYIVVGIADDYIPGEPGSAGVFTNKVVTPSIYMHSSSLNSNVVTQLAVNVTPERIIIFSKYATVNWTCSYLGLPLPLIDRSDNSLALVTGTSVSGPRFYKNNAGEITTPYNLSSYSIVSPTTIDGDGQYVLSEIVVGYPNLGLRGILDGLYCLPANGAVDGQELSIGENLYKVFACATPAGSNSFATLTVAIRIQ